MSGRDGYPMKDVPYYIPWPPITYTTLHPCLHTNRLWSHRRINLGCILRREYKIYKRRRGRNSALFCACLCGMVVSRQPSGPSVFCNLTLQKYETGVHARSTRARVAYWEYHCHSLHVHWEIMEDDYMQIPEDVCHLACIYNDQPGKCSPKIRVWYCWHEYTYYIYFWNIMSVYIHVHVHGKFCKAAVPICIEWNVNDSFIRWGKKAQNCAEYPALEQILFRSNNKSWKWDIFLTQV